MVKAHRETGNPRGRPPKIPFDFGQRIMENLRRRVDVRVSPKQLTTYYRLKV